jgi:hypothetical protein
MNDNYSVRVRGTLIAGHKIKKGELVTIDENMKAIVTTENSCFYGVAINDADVGMPVYVEQRGSFSYPDALPHPYMTNIGSDSFVGEFATFRKAVYNFVAAFKKAYITTIVERIVKRAIR